MTGLTLIDRLAEHGRRNPMGAAYRQAETGQVWTWGELDERSRRLAGKLRGQLPAGATVVLIGQNDAVFAAAFLGVLRAGMAVFPISNGPETSVLAKKAGAQMVLGPEIDFEGPLLGDEDASSAALLLASSGTTGRPKIVRRAARSLNAVIAGMCEAIGFSADDRVLAMAPLQHSYGLEHGLLAPVAAGSEVIVCGGFDLPTAVAELRGEVTIMPAVPFMIDALTHGGFSDRFPNLRSVYSAGGPLPASIAVEFARRFGVDVGQVYGSTEVGSVTFSDPASPGFDSRSVGRLLQNVDVKFDGGQVMIRAGSMFDGYVGETDSPFVDGYFPTGDLGMMSEGGNLYLTGRIRLLIDVGGRKVNPLEVEEVLSEHPLVGTCVVVPMPLAATVTRLKALVVPRNGGPAPKAEELRQFARQRLSSYKLPRVFELRESLPLSPSGKVLREKVKD